MKHLLNNFTQISSGIVYAIIVVIITLLYIQGVALKVSVVLLVRGGYSRNLYVTYDTHYIIMIEL